MLPLHSKRSKKLQRKMKIFDSSQQQLAELLSENEWQPDTTDTLLAVIRCSQYKNISAVVIKATASWYST